MTRSINIQAIPTPQIWAGDHAAVVWPEAPTQILTTETLDVLTDEAGNPLVAN